MGALWGSLQEYGTALSSPSAGERSLQVSRRIEHGSANRGRQAARSDEFEAISGARGADSSRSAEAVAQATRRRKRLACASSPRTVKSRV